MKVMRFLSRRKRRIEIMTKGRRRKRRKSMSEKEEVKSDGEKER